MATIGRRRVLGFLSLGAALSAASAALIPRLAVASTKTLANRMIECAAIRQEIDRLRIEWVAMYHQLRQLEYQGEYGTANYYALEIEDYKLGERVHLAEERVSELERLPI